MILPLLIHPGIKCNTGYWRDHSLTSINTRPFRYSRLMKQFSPLRKHLVLWGLVEESNQLPCHFEPVQYSEFYKTINRVREGRNSAGNEENFQ